MSDYIRKDDVLALLEKYRIEMPSTYSAGLTIAKNAVKGMPTEDVEREIFILDEYGFHEFIKIHCDELDELKKKHGVIEE